MSASAQSSRDQRVLQLAHTMTLKQIGEQVGVSKQRVHQILCKHGIQNNTSTVFDDQIAAMNAKKMSDRAIADAIGKDKQFVRYRRLQLGLPAAQPQITAARIKAVAGLFDQGWSRDEIVSHTNLHPTVVSRYLHATRRSYTAFGEARKPRATSEHVRAIAPLVLRDIENGDTQDEIATRYGITQPVVSRIKTNASKS